ncbi:MAG: DUF1330 domain-containing protein [Alphaproteobacteria bacterium]|nr:MAG: DUF1330 domain-containing protein [Alphaproteobacteria bacterium]
MPKGYIIARIDVTDAEEYGRYTARTPALVAAAGGRFLTRGGRHEALEGEGRSRNVIIEFPDYETARAFYDSPDYRAILPHALKGSTRDLVVVEGV